MTTSTITPPRAHLADTPVDRGAQLVGWYAGIDDDTVETNVEQMIVDLLAFVADWYEATGSTPAEASLDARMISVRAQRRAEGLRARG